jgi:D-glycero-alpha-D-manno-heptose-7-phosphate kinase
VQLDNFWIHEDSPLREALLRISANKNGTIMTTNSTGAVVGLVTDGDIRNRLIKGASLDDAVGSCANSEFVWADQATPREILLKQLDHRIRLIPLLNTARQLIGIVSRDHVPAQTEGSVYARARAPVRMSFGGGGSDVTYYFAGFDGAVINATISLYSHATLRMREDKKIIIHSLDLKDSFYADDLASALKQPGQFGLIQSLIKAIQPEFGFELFLHSDFPMNSGLGGSAVVSASVLGCFNQFRRDQWDQNEIAELAFQAERLYLGVAGGWQDQYATVFGGLNFMEFRMDQNIVHPLRIHPNILLELEESLILCDTGTPHDSGDIHRDQRQQMQQQDIRQQVQSNVALTYQIRNHLLRGRLQEFGKALNEAWQIKRQLSSKITNPRLDQIYAGALAHGALGGKLLGAGGGGFFLFYVPPFSKHDFISHLVAQGLMVRPFRFEQKGLQAWTVRESESKCKSSKEIDH